MNIFINSRKKQITLLATGSETDLFTLIVAFSGDAVVFPRQSKNLFKSLASKVFKMVIIDMTHPSVTKEFIQLLMRTNNIKTI